MKLEATGKNVELAIQNGLLECGLTREDVQVKVLEEGGLFKKAKVVLLWGEDAKAESELPAADAGSDNAAGLPKSASTSSNDVENANELRDADDVKGAGNESLETENAAEIKPKRVVDTSRIKARGQEFLLGLARMVDETATVEVSAAENEVSFAVKGENLGKLIGFHGENIQALQLLLSGLKLRSEGPIRLYLDIAGYKSSRNQTLVDLANKVAEQAIKIERNIHLDPMSAYDRRIIHTTLQGREDVTTESTGEGEKRHVVIKPIFKK